MQAVWQFLCNKPCPAFGLSAWIVVFAGAQLFLSQVGLSLSSPHHPCTSCSDIFLTHHCRSCIMQSNYSRQESAVCSCVQCPNFNSLRVVSFAAAIMSLAYSTIAVGASIASGRQPDAYYNLDTKDTADKVFGVFNALGTVAFA